MLLKRCAFNRTYFKISKIKISLLKESKRYRNVLGQNGNFVKENLTNDQEIILKRDFFGPDRWVVGENIGHKFGKGIFNT